VAEQGDWNAQRPAQQDQRPILLAEVADQPVGPALFHGGQHGGIAAWIESIAEFARVQGDCGAGQALPDQAAGIQHGADFMAGLGQRLRQCHEVRGGAGVLGIGADEEELHARRSS
jgi:hypothetical protein